MSSSLKVFCQQQEMVVSVPTLTDFQAWQLSLSIHYRPFSVRVVRGSSNLPGVCRYEIPGVFQGVESHSMGAAFRYGQGMKLGVYTTRDEALSPVSYTKAYTGTAQHKLGRGTHKGIESRHGCEALPAG